MALETGSFIDDLTITNPLGADAKNEGDDHLRLIKKVLKATFPGMGGAAWRVQTKSGTYTVVAGDNMSTLNCTTALTLNLTAAATLGNQHMFLVVANGGDVTIDPNGAETLNGSATLVVSDGSAAFVACSGSLFVAAVAVGALLTTRGDVLRGSSSAAAERLALGTVGQSMVSDGSDVLWGGAGVLATEQATTTGTAFDFTGIPSWVTQIIVTFQAVSLDGTNDFIIQIGDSGGLETDGYTSTSISVTNSSTSSGATSTAGFVVGAANSANAAYGTLTLDLADAANNEWVASHSIRKSGTAAAFGGGNKSLSGTLDRLRLLTTGSDDFDAGAVNIKYR